MKRLVTLVVCVAGLLSSSAFAQNIITVEDITNSKGMIIFPLRIPSAMNLVGTGNRARGMGNAFLAVSDDVSAISWNPAGLYGEERPVIGFAYGSYKPKGTYDVTGSDLLVGLQSDLSKTFGGVSLLSFTAPVRIKGHPFVVAASYSTTSNEYDYSRLRSVFSQESLRPDGTIGNEYYDITLDRIYRSRMDVVNFGFGTRISSKMSAGASVNVYTNKSVGSQERFVHADSLYLNAQAQTVESRLSALDTSWYSGVNFTIGWKYKDEKFSVGVVVKSPFNLRYNTNRTLDNTQWFNGLKQDTTTAYFDDILTKIEMPITFGLGGAIYATPKLLLAADVEYRPYSGKQIKLREKFEIVPGEKDRETYSVYDPQWKNVLAFRTGAEYSWETGSQLFPLVPIRAGFAYTPLPAVAIGGEYGYIPLPENSADYASDQKTNMTTFSFGAGVKWTQIYVDASFSYSTLKQDHSVATLIDAETKIDATNFGLTFTGYF